MSFKEQCKDFLSRHRWTIALVLCGLVLCVLVMTINFWRTLLLCVVLGICFLIGGLMDKGGWEMVKRFFDRFLPKS